MPDFFGHEFDSVLIPRANPFRYLLNYPTALQKGVNVLLDALAIDFYLWGSMKLQPVTAGHGIDVHISRAMPTATINASAM